MESSGTGWGREPAFEVSANPESASANPRFESLNVCRVAGLSTLFAGEPGLLLGIATQLEETGFTPTLTTGHRTLAGVDPADLLAELAPDLLKGDRIGYWSAIQLGLSPYSAVAFLIAVLGSSSERESAAAAAALWHVLTDIDSEQLQRYPLPDPRFEDLPVGPGISTEEAGEWEVQPLRWDADAWQSIYGTLLENFGDPGARVPILALLTRWRLIQALRSVDPITVSLAAAAGLPPETLSPEPPGTVDPPSVTPKAPRAKIEAASTIIHGTWGWKGAWWRPGGDFHRFISTDHRPNLYSRGARFSWSGYYRTGHRQRAASDFCEWASEIAPNGLRSVFGHSYGGEVCARAALAGANIEELILLSTPATDPVVAAARSGMRIVDVRLRFDPVLALARTPQDLPKSSNVTPVRLRRWTLDHADSHKEQVWIDEEIARRGNI